MGDLKYLLPILVAVILVWITYLVINFVATIIKTFHIASISSKVISFKFHGQRRRFPPANGSQIPA